MVNYEEEVNIETTDRHWGGTNKDKKIADYQQGGTSDNVKNWSSMARIRKDKETDDGQQGGTSEVTGS